jgi:hypothetical protein
MAVLYASFYLLGHRFWSSCWMVVGCGGLVFFYRVDNGVLAAWRSGVSVLDAG